MTMSDHRAPGALLTSHHGDRRNRSELARRLPEAAPRAGHRGACAKAAGSPSRRRRRPPLWLHRRLPAAQPAASPAAAGAAGATPKRGGEIHLRDDSRAKRPRSQTAPTAPCWAQSFTRVPRLTHFDDQGITIPDLAEKWEISRNRLTWTFALKSGVKFHDGTAFNASAVKINLVRIRPSSFRVVIGWR